MSTTRRNHPLVLVIILTTYMHLICIVLQRVDKLLTASASLEVELLVAESLSI